MYTDVASADIRVQEDADAPAKVEAPPPLNVHIVFSNHLDVGFDKNDTGGTDNHIISVNFKKHFPAAIKCADELRELDGLESMKYMTHSWLVSLFLDCPPDLGIDCPDDDAKKAFVDAVQRGDIWWHAMPFNSELEFMDRSMLQANIQLTHELDRSFGLPPKVTMSQRDVPGFTRAAVPILVDQGVKAVTLGVNGGSAPPDVPHNTPFLWHDKQSGTEIIAMWHPGGYSGSPVDQGTDPENGCVITEKFNHVLCAAWNDGDNSGPQNSTRVQQIFDLVRGYFPGANVFASTFDDFTNQLVAAKDQLDLPVVYSEVGDTWIHGVQSDADRVAEFRAFMRMRRTMPDQFGSYMMRNFTRFMVKVPEHTWGPDVKVYLNDYANWSNDLFEAVRSSENYNYMEAAWTRQRSYTRWALEALKEGSSARLKFFGVLEELEHLKKVPDLDALGFTAFNANDNLTFSSHAWTITIDPNSGGLSSLSRNWANGRKGRQWANAGAPLGRFMYSTYTEDDFNVIWDTYQYVQQNADWWFRKDFGKENVSSASPNHSTTYATVQGMWAKQDSADSFEFISLVTLPQELVTNVGAPAQVWQWFKSPSTDDRLLYNVLWVNKTATRLPEALWVQFTPDAKVADPDTWAMSKLGSLVSPLDVVRNGSHSMHAVDDDGVLVNALGYTHSWEQLKIRTLDCALVSPGEPNPFPNVNTQPDMSKGVAFNLGNNIWGTNYIMWQPYVGQNPNMGFRFEIEMLDQGISRDLLSRQQV
ncbi:g9640 [Coccomyxa elongata]